MPFTVSVLVGSARPNRAGITVANLVANKLKARGHTVHLIDPVEYKAIQTFTDRYQLIKEPHADLVKIHNLLQESDGFVAVTPEYNYMYSSQIKIFLDTYLAEWKYKPIGLVGYSISPFGGVRAVEQLRGSVNVLGMSPVPTFACLPTVKDQFDENGELKNEFNRKAFDDLYRELEWYLAALANHRKLDPSVLPKHA